MKKLNRVGEKYKTTQGYEIEIVEYFGAFDCTVKFLDGTLLKNLLYLHIKRGNVKNPYHLSIFGVGYLGVGKYTSFTNSNIYTVWYGILRRCYCKKFQEKHTTYIGCTLDKRWHNFQVFAKWFEKNYVEGFELDKDILVKGNKSYSQETCVFIPQGINKVFTKCNKVRGEYPIGVVKRPNNKFNSRLSIEGVRNHLGVFDTPEEAFQSYKIAKEKEIKRLADGCIHQITEACYQALINYKVEIND